MRSTRLKARELCPDLMAQWIALQDSDFRLFTPALRPELFKIVGGHHPSAEVAVIEDAGRVAAFFPFDRHPTFSSLARPIPMCDYQDYIRSPNGDMTAAEILAASGVSTWLFENLLAGPDPAEVSEPFSHFVRRIDVRSTFEEYASQLKTSGKSMWNLSNKLRLLARDHGEVVFSANSLDEKLLSVLLGWKALRFNGGQPIQSWIWDAVHEIFSVRTPEFRGVLTTLHAGDTPVAAHFGIQANQILYYWFSSFNPGFSRYTPGLILLHFMSRGGENGGYRTIDLGPGGHAYKDYFCNLRVPALGGQVELPTLLNVARRSYRGALKAVRRNSTARNLLRPIAQMIRGS